MMKRELFKVEGDKIIRTRKTCPKCGPGVFLAEHKDRFSCGKCGYTEFKGSASLAKEKAQQPKEEIETKEKEEETSKEEPKVDNRQVEGSS
jgi:small subunit ribosomal protein S27Ae